jgi:uncharacterized protein YdaU (DUF1376 family)
MSGESVKAYIYLLCESWLQEPRGTLPNNENELASMARLSQSEWDAVKGEVLPHFKVGECRVHKGRLFNDTLLEISCKYHNKQRFNNKNAKRTQSERKVNAPLEIEIDNDIDLNFSLKGECEGEFEKFRLAYPGTKRGLNTELKDFQNKNKDWTVVVPKLLESLNKEKEWRAVGNKTPGFFCPSWANLKTWLSQRRWEQTLEEPKPKTFIAPQKSLGW